MVALLFKAGNQVPVIPLEEVVGKAAKVPPEQIGATVAKFGVTLGFTVIVNALFFTSYAAFDVHV